MAPRRWPVFCGNVEGADLKQNNQSTTQIDPEAGTGRMLCLLSILVEFWPCDRLTFGKVGKHRHLLKGAARPKLGGHEFPYTEWLSIHDTWLFILATQRSAPINCWLVGSLTSPVQLPKVSSRHVTWHSHLGDEVLVQPRIASPIVYR